MKLFSIQKYNFSEEMNYRPACLEGCLGCLVIFELLWSLPIIKIKEIYE